MYTFKATYLLTCIYNYITSHYYESGFALGELALRIPWFETEKRCLKLRRWCASTLISL